MDTETRNVLSECTRASDEGSMNFPAVVAKLVHAGVERYHTDLLRGERIYYLPNGESEVTPMHRPEASVAASFVPNAIVTALRAVQAGTATYKEFCEDIMAAGCVGYIVSMAGRRAVYYGRTGESYVESFPGAK
jgi:uncharacterized protein YbcV (DUF1398 family)